MKYSDYLKSEHWQQQRRLALNRADNRCESCGCAGPLEVHHRTYQRLGRERPEDLRVVCHGCHSRYHEVDVKAPWDNLKRDILHVLDAGPAPTNKIAKLTKRQRNLVQDALKQLQAEGVVMDHRDGTWSNYAASSSAS